MAVAPERSGGKAAGELRLPDREWAREYGPLLSLLVRIWQVPQVGRLGLTSGGGRLTVWAFLEKDDAEAEGAISDAERAYLNATVPHPFEVQVVPLSDVAEGMLPPVEILLER